MKIGLFTLLISIILGVVSDLNGQACAAGPKPTHNCEARRTIARADGSLIVIGDCEAGRTTYQIAAAQLTSLGQVDSRFGERGLAIVNSPNGKMLLTHDAAIQPDGKMILTGWVATGQEMQGMFSDNDIFVLRLNPDGSLDTSFGARGFTILGFGSGHSEDANSIVVQQDGKIVVAGSVHDGRSNDFAVFRLSQNGVLDPAFGQEGKLKLALTNGGDIAEQVVEQKDGTLIIAGVGLVDREIKLAVVFLDPTGEVDPPLQSSKAQAFALENPFARINLALGKPKFLAYSADTPARLFGPPVSILKIPAAAVNARGDIFRLSAIIDSSYATLGHSISKQKSTGLPDAAFGRSGRTTLLKSPGSVNGASITLQPDDKILVTGYSFTSGSKKMAVTRLLGGNGQIDTAFGTSGKVLIPYPE